MRDGGDWIIYLFAVLFAIHACITIGVLVYRLTRTKEVRKNKTDKPSEEQDKA